MDVTIYSANPSLFEYETNQLLEIVEVLKSAEPANNPIYMITNVFLGNRELDCILITEKGPIIIDCKPYQGKITGCESGSWEVESSSGEIIVMDTNPFEQSKLQRYGFLRKWDKIVKKHFISQIPPKQVFNFCNWVYFKPESKHIDDRFDFSKVKWFKIVTKETLVDSIKKLNHQYRISKLGYGKILKEFGLNEDAQVQIPISASPDSELSGEKRPQIIKTLSTPSGPVHLIVQMGVIQIATPPSHLSHTPEFLSAYHEAEIYFKSKNYAKALNHIEFVLHKEQFDQKAQDLKYEILCELGRDEEAEEYLIQVMKGKTISDDW